MGRVSLAREETATEIDRNALRDTEADFGLVLNAIAQKLYPPPNTAAQIAAELPCSVRLIEMYFEGRLDWSDTAIVFLISEILRRKRMRNFKVTKRN